MLKFMPKKYLLKDGSIYWHKLYFDLMPDWTTKAGPLGGNYNYAYYFVKPSKLVEDWYYQAKWFIQRGYRGYSDSDVWGWYSHMARINVAALRRLADNKIGHPCGMTMKGWHMRLLKMADGFQAVIDEEDDMISYKRLSRKEYLSLCRHRQRRLEAGLKLYSKCFQNLWD